MAPRRIFGRTWWGRTWVEALEDSAALDPSRLASGRTYANQGRVGSIEISPGFASARVTGKHGRYYRTDVGVKPLAPSEWDQVVDAIASVAGHAAALLDGELPPRVVADAAALDIALLPGPGHLRPDCSCPDWAEPCKHAAALCYLLADEIDRDPFVLLTLRGMRRSDLMELVRARRSELGGEAGDDEPRNGDPEALGVDAAEVWRDRPLDAPLERLPEVVAHALAAVPPRPVSPPAWDASLPAELGISPTQIDRLAADAADRAFDMLTTDAPSQLRIGSDADLARRASTLDRLQADSLARAMGWHPSYLAARVEAWRLAGELGVLMLADSELWSTDQAALDAGRDALMGVGFSRRQVSLNYDSLRMRGNVWLALGPDGRWYRLHESGKRHEMRLDAAPSEDITDLVEPPPPSE